MRIGEMKMNIRGQFEGRISTAQRFARFLMEATKAENRRSDNTPDYQIFGVHPDSGEVYDLGAAWNKTKEENGASRPYISISMDNYDWPSPITCAAWPVKGRAGEYDLVWTRKEPDAAVRKAA
jgi:uncharacterized protein (DUF736 family)